MHIKIKAMASSPSPCAWKNTHPRWWQNSHSFVSSRLSVGSSMTSFSTRFKIDLYFNPGNELLPGFCLEWHFENARLSALLREIALVTAINETDTMNAVSLLNGLHDVVAIRINSRSIDNYHSLQKCIFTAVFAEDLGVTNQGRLHTWPLLLRLSSTKGISR